MVARAPGELGVAARGSSSCVDAAASPPFIGARAKSEKGLRRFYLRRLRYFLYYRVSDDVVDVLAFWHEARGQSPGIGK